MSTEATPTPAEAPAPTAPARQRVVLLGKEHDITAFASTDTSRFVLNSVHYNEKAQCLEATNGHFLIRVPVEVDGGDFPPLSGQTIAPVDCILPIAPFKKALTSIPNGGSLDILKHVALSSSDGGKVRLTTNDLYTENNVVTKPIEGNYPKCDAVIPTEPAKFAIALDPSLLKTVVEYFAKHNSEKARAIRLEFTTLDDDKSPVRITGTLASGKQALAILMPMRLS